MSRSVTSREVFDPLLLQIEMLSRGAGVLSRSVTSRPVSAELVLQIETIAGEGSRHVNSPFVFIQISWNTRVRLFGLSAGVAYVKTSPS